MFQTAKQKPADDFRFQRTKKNKGPSRRIRQRQTKTSDGCDADAIRCICIASATNERTRRNEKKQTTETATESAPQNSSDRWQCVPPPLRRNVIRPRPWTAMATRVDHCQFKFAPFQFETEIYVKLKTFLLFLFFCCFFFLLPQAVEIDSVDKEAPEFLPGK